MIKIQSFVKWSGSKKSQAEKIIGYFPESFNTYYEPFLGGGSILGALKPKKAICGDVCFSLIKLWEEVQNNPEKASTEYKKKWNDLDKKGYTYFLKIRSDFNQLKLPFDLLFLTRTCVNGLIRFNKKGEFNNSFHHSRKGMNPLTLEKIIFTWSKIIKDYKFYCKDYRELTKKAKKGDFIYLDPPYFHTKGRYFGAINFDDFMKYLDEINKKGIKYALSFDGQRGDKSYTVKIPKKLYRRHIYLHSGNSTFRKVQDKKVEKVYESLYLNY
jgi:DNA adenine methylase